MKLTKEECVMALKRFAKPFQASIDVQKNYYDCNGEEFSINEDCYLLFKLINEHFDSSLTREKLEKALELACEDIADVFGNCPLDQFNHFTSRCENCQDEYKECWKEYYMSEVFGDETN